jgi:GT2 family glycosyltransferase
MNYQKLNEKYLVSVVIPTLGGHTLNETIHQLNRSILKPKEILICIPQTHAHKVVDSKISNVKIIITSFSGQVAQRAHGFVLAKYPYVLQVDDDLQVTESCLLELVTFLESKQNVAVAPSLLGHLTGKLSNFMSKPDRHSSFLYKSLFWIVNGKKGYQAGRISKAGVNMGFSRDAIEPYEVDWLPGGCVLHLRENLIKYNYYPYKGKAFAEDLFQSAILRKNGIKLYHCPAAVVYLDNTSSKSSGFKSLMKIFFSYSRIMMRFALFSGSNMLRLFIFLILHHLILIFRKFKLIF